TLIAVVAIAGAALTGLGRGGRFSRSGRGASTWGAFGAGSFLGPGSRHKHNTSSGSSGFSGSGGSDGGSGGSDGGGSSSF
ncbi:MAG TPA: hypothetical protein VLI04_21175, partial [Nocardioidaceae bacterium]|nr:hypothetical protein [Nocardioidaceae bacterium]